MQVNNKMTMSSTMFSLSLSQPVRRTCVPSATLTPSLLSSDPVHTSPASKSTLTDAGGQAESVGRSEHRQLDKGTF